MKARSSVMYAFGRVTIPAAQVFYRSALSIAFVNISPVLPGHVLVAPLRTGIMRVAALEAAEAADLFSTSQHVGRVVEASESERTPPVLPLPLMLTVFGSAYSEPQRLRLSYKTVSTLARPSSKCTCM